VSVPGRDHVPVLVALRDRYAGSELLPWLIEKRRQRRRVALLQHTLLDPGRVGGIDPPLTAAACRSPLTATVALRGLRLDSHASTHRDGT
jgi:hypothetical protein